MKQIHLFKKGFVIFLKGAPFSDFIDNGLWNYMPSGIQIHFPLFWRIFFPLGSNLIKLWSPYKEYLGDKRLKTIHLSRFEVEIDVYTFLADFPLFVKIDLVLF